MEPVHGSTVDDSWEHSSSDSESISNWGEAKSQMQVLSNLVLEEVKQGIRSILTTVLFGLRSNFTEDSIKLILREELWDVSRGKEIVNVYKESLISDLGISQDEEKLSSSNTSLHEHVLDIGLEINKLVVGSNNNSNNIV